MPYQKSPTGVETLVARIAALYRLVEREPVEMKVSKSHLAGRENQNNQRDLIRYWLHKAIIATQSFRVPACNQHDLDLQIIA